MHLTLVFQAAWEEAPGGVRLAPEDVEKVLVNHVDRDVSHLSGLPIVFGFVPDGRQILVVYGQIDEITICPMTESDPTPGACVRSIKTMKVSSAANAMRLIKLN